MKRILTFFFALFAVLGTWAAAELPQFATEQAGKWYYVQFSTGGAFLTDEGINNTLTASAAAGLPGQKWKLVGTKEGFLLKNQNGRYAKLNGMYQAANDGTTFKLVQSLNSSHADSWEIRLTDNSAGMNQNGGAGIGQPIGSWDGQCKDENNAVTFVAAKKVDVLIPEFSTIQNPSWYKLKFITGGHFLEDKGAGILMTTNDEVACKEQKWQFVGTPGNYKLRNRTGNYLCLKNFEGKGDRFTTTNDATEAVTLQLAISRNAAGFEIQRKVAKMGSSMNQNGGTGKGAQLAEYGYNDPNNKLTCIADPFVGLPEFSTEDNPKWYKLVFKAGGHYLEDKGTGNLKTADAAITSAQQWMFIGDEYGFTMKSASGNFVKYEGGSTDRFMSAAAGTKMKFVQHEKDGYSLELQPEGSGECMNQNGGTAAGKELAAYTKNDVNNAFSLVLDQSCIPSFSKNEYFYILFGTGRHVLADKGLDQFVKTEDFVKDQANQQWTFEGDVNNFQIKSKSGRYANIKKDGNDNKLFLSSEKYSKGFKLVYSENAKNPASFEIKPNDIDGYFNQWGGTGGNNAIGFWGHQNDNNALYFPSVIDYKDIIPEVVTPPTPPISKPDDFKVTGATACMSESALTLWYDEPATTTGVADKWMEYALPIGNGQLGACIFGGIADDEIQFNEKTLWESGPVIGWHGGYKNFGSVFVKNLGTDIQYKDENGAQNYSRFLDIEKAVAGVNFENKATEKTSYERRYISSNPDNVIAVRYTATGKEKLHLQFTFAPGEGINASAVTYENGYASFSGKMTTLSYNAQFRVVPTGGEDMLFYSDEEGVSVSNATEVLLILRGATDFDPKSPTFTTDTENIAAGVKNTIDAAATKGWEALYNAHVADFQGWMSRVSFKIDGAASKKTTKQLIDEYSTRTHQTPTSEDLFLEQLYFAYGRYLMISCSRGVDLPSNLQGIWNHKAQAPWNGDIHSNINVQMNYWPAEPTNLSDLHLPFLNYIINCANGPIWKEAAQISGHAENSDGKPYVEGEVKGWTLFTENNIFGGMSTWGSNYCVANAWYCSHLWQHYRYTLDKDFLKRAFPVMWSAAEYWMQRMIQDRGHKNGYQPDGTYVCPDEFSAEQHDNGKEDGTAHAQQLVYGLLTSVKQSVDILGAEAGLTPEQLTQLEEYLAKTDKGLHIEKFEAEKGWDEWGARFGVNKGDDLLKEWKYTSYAISKDKGHRHMSHLMALYPLDQIAPDSKYFIPAKNALKLRGDDATGWSMGWKVNLWARALDGDHAHLIIHNALKHSTAYGTDQSRGGVYYNLFDSHAPFQIDGNFGTCAGMAEMLMQSHTGTIQILPALPKVWKSGSITGMKAVGNFEVSIEWANNKATTAVIKSVMGSELKVNYPGISKVQVLVGGVEVKTTVIDENTIQIPAEKGEIVMINFNEAKADKASFEIPTKEGFGTIYLEKAFVMPEGVKGATVKAVTPGEGEVGSLVADWAYPAGSTVPAKTALLLNGVQGKYFYNVAVDATAAPTDNLLKGSVLNEMTQGTDCKFYKLSYDQANTNLGFYWGAENGTAFQSKAGKAYLAVPTAQAQQAKGFRLDDLVTGIEGVETAESSVKAVYNLAGVRVKSNLNQLPKGVYIVNGKKVIIK